MSLDPHEERVIARRDTVRWFVLAVAAIAVAGAFALFLVVARLPGIADVVVTDPQFAWRGLIVHVNLSLGVWFFAFLAGMFCLLPGARRMRVTPIAFWLAVAGTVAFTLTVFIESAEPIRSNYVPALDHWLFLLGIGAFGAAVLVNFADARMLASGNLSQLPPDARITLKAAAVAYITAMITIAAAWATQPDNVLPLAYYERLFWGGGHVLQFANVLAMISVWLMLLATVLKRPVLNPALAGVLALVLLAPSLPGPWFTATRSPPQYFTEMMRWGIFPAASLFIVACIYQLMKAHSRGLIARGALKSTAFVGFLTAAVMTVLGFLLGSMIREDNTLVPAHYHMSIGAVTASFMAGMLVLLGPLGAPLKGPRAQKWAVWQPLIFGAGQAVFALGFAIAGLAGAERKAYGTDQVVHSVVKSAGLITMGAGGLVASVGGVVFLVLLVVAWLGRHKSNQGLTAAQAE